nr:hypothetical protein [Tanacetum cinerariifolium]
MDTTIDQQVAMDGALVPHAQIFRIGRRNFRLLSDIKSKESTLNFRDMLHICPRVHGQSFAEPPFKEEILAFIRFLGYSPRLTTFAKGKQAAKPSKAKSLYALSKVAMTEAQQLKLVTKRSLQQTHISQVSVSGTDEGTGSIPGVPDVPSDESEEELSWNSTDNEGDAGEEGDGDNDDEDNDGEEGDDDDDDDDQEVVRDDDKDDEKDDEEEGGDDEQEYAKDEYDEETRDEESFDPIPKTPEKSDDEGNGEEDHGLNVGREEGHDKEEEENELYKDVNINQGRGIQATLEVEYSHVTLTPVNPDGQPQISSVSSQFVTSMLNPTLDVGMESIFETTSQMDAQTPNSVAPLPMTAPAMTPSTIATITTTTDE